MSMDDAVDESPEAMLGNPSYAVVFAESLFDEHDIDMAQEDWVKQSAAAIKEHGATEWLAELLYTLKSGNTRNPVLNPTRTIVISASFRGDNDALVSAKTWIEANEKLLAELGAEKWLQQLLDILSNS